MAAVQLYKIMRRMWPHNEWTSGHWALPSTISALLHLWFCVGPLLGRLKVDQTPRAAIELHQTFAISRHNNDNKIGHYKTWHWYGTSVWFRRYLQTSSTFLFEYTRDRYCFKILRQNNSADDSDWQNASEQEGRGNAHGNAFSDQVSWGATHKLGEIADKVLS